MNPEAGDAAESTFVPAADPGRQALRLKLAIGGAMLAALLLLSPARWAALPDLCAFHLQTGLPCAGCGLTRSWAAVVHLDLPAAFRYHLFGPPLFLLAGLWMLGGRWRAWMKRVPLFVLLLIGGIWLLYWGLRLKGFFPIP